MTRRDRLCIASVAILAAGLAAAVLIYLGAGDDAADPTDQITSSKMYVRQLQLYGGRASVLFDELMRWFGGLWHGRTLAFTVGWLSALASAGVFLCALRSEAEDPPRSSGATFPSTASAGSSEDPASPPREGR